jgi:dienelactone hydrolase
MRTLILSGLAAALMAGPTSAAATQSGEVHYRDNDTTMHGFLARPGGEERRPAVLVVHEWWGHDEHARRRAQMLAELGYVALAVDMYGEGRLADHPDDARRFMSEVRQNMDLGERRFLAALDVLRNHPEVDPERIAAIGYCFGGSMVLEMARRGHDLKGVVSFHGGLATENPAQPSQVKSRVLVLNGAADPLVTQEHIEAFKAEMEAAEVDYRFVNYEGALHGFTNTEATRFGQEFGMPLAYDAEADAASWEEMKQFFESLL